MSEVDIYQKLTEIEEAPRFSMIFGESSDRSDKISEHRLWLQNIRKEHPLPATPYRVGVYIRYFNQTKYENYLDYHIKNYEDTLALCPKWTLVDFYIDEGATAPNMESAPEWCRLLDDCFDGKVDLIITQKVSNVSKKSQEITFVSRLLASLDKPVGIYFISEDIFTLASYYKADIQDKEFLPEGFQVLPEPNVRGELHD
jgi:hypothetical protein